MPPLEQRSPLLRQLPDPTFATSVRPPHTRLSPQGPAAAKQAPPCVPARQPGPLEGGGPVPAALRPAGQRGGRPRLRGGPGWGRGRGGGCRLRLRRPADRAPRGRGRGQARRGPQPASPARRRCFSPRLRGSGLAIPLAVQRWLCRRRRRRRALLTRSSTTPDRLLKSGRVVARPLAAARTRVSLPDPDLAM